MSIYNDLAEKIERCPSGGSGWRIFEDTCIECLNLLFVPPLQTPIIQARTITGGQRRDAIYANRNYHAPNHWRHLLTELNARMILFEFKNYDDLDIGTSEVDQTLCYMRAPMGNLAILVSNKLPNRAAHIRRNTIFSNDRKVILFLTKDHIREMLYIKERGETVPNFV